MILDQKPRGSYRHGLFLSKNIWKDGQYSPFAPPPHLDLGCETHLLATSLPFSLFDNILKAPKTPKSVGPIPYDETEFCVSKRVMYAFEQAYSFPEKKRQGFRRMLCA
jgi:hypothetical protein